MKKYLLTLIAFFSLQAMAMVEETVTYNFKEPLNLNVDPPYTANQTALLNSGEGGGVLVNISDRTIINGPVSLSFSRPTNTPGAGIARYGSFCLEIGRLLSLSFSVSDGCILTSIYFDQDTDITKPSNQPGSWNYITRTWTATDNSTTSVILKNGDASGRIYNITVKYQRPSTPINFISSSPAQGTTVDSSFKTMTMSFSSSIVQVNNASNIKLTGKDVDGIDINQTMTVSTLGSSITLTAPVAITKDADLKVTVPAGTFQNSEGAVTMEDIVVSFKVMAKRDTFNPTKIEPNAGIWNALPKEIRLTFPNFVKPGTGSIKFTQTDGSLSFSVNATNITVENNVAVISHNHDVVDAGNWKVEIPTKAFHNDFAETDAEYRWNAALTINYVIDGSAVGPQDSQTMKDAKTLLQKTGVGYPKTTDPAWIALKALVDAEETPTDEALAAAMTALYNATDVQMPEVDKWYTISGFNTEGKNIYLTFNDDKTRVTLGTNANSAAAFKVKSVADGKVVFQTKEGLFLHIPTVLPQHEGTSDTNLTGEESDINKLTLAKFSATSVIGANPVALFGAFTIYGSLGKVTGFDVEDFAYAMLDFENTKIATYPNVALAFAAKMSSAFLLAESTEPTDVVDLITPVVGFIPDAIDNAGDYMEMKVNGPTSTVIADNSLIYYAEHTPNGGVGQKVNFSEAILTSIPNETNKFVVNTKGLTPGMYFLVMENGAFTYTVPAGKGIRPISLVGGPITIKDNSGDVTPTASLNTSQLKAGDPLVLKIGNVGKATIKTPSAPYYEYTSGDNAGTKVNFTGTILTSKANTTAEFNVNTSGLEVGSYRLVLPSETFIFEPAQEGQIVKNNIQLVVYFDIFSQGGTFVDEGFNYSYNSGTMFFPASLVRTSGFYRDTDLNQMIYYTTSPIGLVANPNKRVSVKPKRGGNAVTTGYFVPYTTFKQDYPSYYSEILQYEEYVYALKFIPDPAIEAGALDNLYGGTEFVYTCEEATIGDLNYGKWLADNSSIDPSQCIVNKKDQEIGMAIPVDNHQVPSGINTVNFKSDNQIIYDLQGRKVENAKKGVYIVNGKKIYVK